MHLLIFLFLCSLLFSEEKPIVAVIPSYNNASWYHKNLESVFSQEYENYRVIYVDDHSTDGTAELVDTFVRAHHQEKRVALVRNSERVGALCNTYRAVWMCKPEEIVVILDGDDWLAHPQVFSKLNEVYSDPDVWMTYGQFQYYPSGDPGWARRLPDEVILANSVRYYHWVTTHLRSFYAGLFQKIRMQDLFYENWFFTTAGDLAYTWPMCEMAGRRARFIPDVLYIYNVASPLNDHKVNYNLQVYYTYVIRAKERYMPLQSL